MIWGGKKDNKENTSLTKFQAQSKNEPKSSKKPRRPQQDDRKNSPYHNEKVWESKKAVPAVRQNSSEKKVQDLRPAVFIKDLKKRSYKLEEEKAQYRGQPKKTYEKKEKQHQQFQAVNHEVMSLQKAISSNDLKVLTDTIYEVKKNQTGSKKESEKMKITIQNAIS